MIILQFRIKRYFACATIICSNDDFIDSCWYVRCWKNTQSFSSIQHQSLLDIEVVVSPERWLSQPRHFPRRLLAIHANLVDVRNDLIASFDSVIIHDGFGVFLAVKGYPCLPLMWLLFRSNVQLTSPNEYVFGFQMSVLCRVER